MIKPKGLYVSTQNLENHCNETIFIIGFGDIWIVRSRMYVRSSTENLFRGGIENIWFRTDCLRMYTVNLLFQERIENIWFRRICSRMYVRLSTTNLKNNGRASGAHIIIGAIVLAELNCYRLTDHLYDATRNRPGHL